MDRKLKITILYLFLILFTAAPQAQALLYEGSLTGAGGGITATDGWDSPSTMFSWSISDVGVQNGDILWQYNYLFEVPRKDISHMIIEVSPEASDNEFAILSGSSAGVQVYGEEGNSNPNIPENMWGIKFEEGSLVLAASFQTTRAPVWGDFYAKDGVDDGINVTAWHTGVGTLVSLPATSIRWIRLQMDPFLTTSCGRIPSRSRSPNLQPCCCSAWASSVLPAPGKDWKKNR